MIALGENWYKDLIQFRVHNKGSDVTFGIQKNTDEIFWQDVDLWYKLPSWEIQRFINCTAISDAKGYDINI